MDPATLVIDPTYPETETWRDYFGGQVYGDFQVDVTPGTPYVATATDQQAYLAGPGLAQQDADGANTRYHHGDLIDSSMLLTDDAGAAVSAVSYTAFGEPVVWTGSAWQIGGELAEGQPRYAYAGGWGYESGHYQDAPEGSTLPGFSDLLALYGPNAALPPLTLQHVGWRWYQAEIGRFLERDPIGTDGGLNVYAYCRARPATLADPSGQGLWKWIYTGDWDASDEEYDAAVGGAAGWLVDHSWVRGGYVGVGTPWNRGVNASAGVSWSIDNGFNWYVCIVAGWSKRGGNDKLRGTYSSNTWGLGYTWSGGEGGPGGGIVGGVGQNQKAHGGYAGAGTDGGIAIGGSAGIIQGGVTLDPGKFIP